MTDDDTVVFEECRLSEESESEDGPDDLQLMLESYLRLPEYFDLSIRGDEVRLLITDFPALLQEAMDFSFQKYFEDFWKTIPGLTDKEKLRLSNEFANLFRQIRGFYSRPEGALLDRVESNTIELPRALSRGLVESVTVGNELEFRFEASPPDAATFAAVKGITFRCFGQDIALRALHLRSENGICEIVPELEVVQLSKPANMVDLLKHKLISGVLKLKKLCLKSVVNQEEFRQYLRDGANLKSALREHKNDILSILDRLSDIKIDDTFARALFRTATRYKRNLDRIEITKEKSTICEVGGLNLTLALRVAMRLHKRTDQMQISEVDGVGVRIPFEPPSQLSAVGFNLSKSMPNEINGLTLGLISKAKRRKIVVGIGVNRWISCLVDRHLEPVFDHYGHWTLSGVVTNPISNNGQSFYLRLNRDFEIDMTVAEMMSLFTDTAMEGFDPVNPITWHWGLAALGTGAISNIGEGILKERTLSNLKDGAAGAIKKGADAARKGADAAASAAEKLRCGAKAAADLFRKKEER